MTVIAGVRRRELRTAFLSSPCRIDKKRAALVHRGFRVLPVVKYRCRCGFSSLELQDRCGALPTLAALHVWIATPFRSEPHNRPDAHLELLYESATEDHETAAELNRAAREPVD